MQSESDDAAAAKLVEQLPAYFERAPLAAALLGISSGFPYAMIGATLTTRLSQDWIREILDHGVFAGVPRL